VVEICVIVSIIAIATMKIKPASPLLVLISCGMCNRFRSLDRGLIQPDNFVELCKSAPRSNITENTQLIHGLSLMCITSAVVLTEFPHGSDDFEQEV